MALIPFHTRAIPPRSKPRNGRPNGQEQTRALMFQYILTGVVVWVAVMLLLHGGAIRRYTNLALGQKAPATVVAVIDFECEDTAQTELNRRQAVDKVLPAFTINQGPYGTAGRKLDKLFNRIAEYRKRLEQEPADGDLHHEVGNVLDLLDLPLTPEEALSLVAAGGEETVLNALKNCLRMVWNEGIVSPQDRETLFQGEAVTGDIILIDPENQKETVISVPTLRSPDQAVERAARLTEESLPDLKWPQEALVKLLTPLVRPNLVFDARSTKDRKAQAAKGVVQAVMTVRAGTTLMENRERITPQILEMLREHEQRLQEVESPQDRWMKRLGDSGLVLAFLLMTLGMAHFFKPAMAARKSLLSIFILLTLITLLVIKGVLYLSQGARLISPWLVEYLIPLAFPALLAGILLGASAAITIGFWISLVAALMFDHTFSVFTIGLLATMVAALASRDVRRRVHVLRAGLSVGLAVMLLAVSYAALDQQTMSVMLSQALAGLLGGLLAALLVALLLPLFEWLFHITTSISLLELSDMSHPLLQRLAMEAPGTYHHSLMVSNLAQTAAMEIGANALLVRVCGYYHDVGKLTKPEFFSENTHLRNNPHDDLTPNMSALVILSHIKDGVGLAQRYRLPQPIVDGIRQHHGTGLVSFFYHLALQRQDAEAGGNRVGGGRGVLEQDFRYEGPRPKSPEMAILSIADAVEAASRSLEKPSPIRIENMVHDIVAAKLADGQLDDCNLTFSQLSAIKKSLVFSLTNMLHGRIAYVQNENKSAPSTNKPDDTPSGAAPARAVDGG